MKRMFLRSIGVSITACSFILACFLIRLAWDSYTTEPWTRDGRIGVEVAQIAPEVSGSVIDLPVTDNQRIGSGEILYRIDPERFQIAVEVAQAGVDHKKLTLVLCKSVADRSAKLGSAISSQQLEKDVAAFKMAEVEYQSTLIALRNAKLDLERTTVRSPVDGFVTNLRLRVGDYAHEGTTTIAVIDSGSFWVAGYFEETKVRKIHRGDTADIILMGSSSSFTGIVESVGRGIADSNDSANRLGLPQTNPVFNWVRLAQRIPVRIKVEQLPPDTELFAGETCSVSVNHDSSGKTKGRLIQWLRERL
jgi:multidrug resistance efflux pump